MARKQTVRETRSTKDLPMTLVVLGIGVLAIIMWLIPAIPVNLLSAIIIIIFGFFFATVSSRMVGLVGSSNNPCIRYGYCDTSYFVSNS